jgi:hypothetical protein
MAAPKPLTIEEFATLIPDIQLGKLSKFSRFDATTKQRVETENGRKIDLKKPDDKNINLQPTTINEPFKAPFGISLFIDEKGQEKWNVTLTPSKDSRAFEALQRFDERILEEGKKHPEWFREAGWKGKQLSESNIETNFGSSLKEPEPDTKTGEIRYPDYQWKLSVFPKNLVVVVKDEATEQYKLHTKDGHLHIHQKPCSLVPVCTPAYIWFTGNQWGVKWFMNKLVVTETFSRGQADVSDMLGMDGLDIVVVSEEAVAEEAPAVPEKRKAVFADDSPSSKRPAMEPPSMEDMENLFAQS